MSSNIYSCHSATYIYFSFSTIGSGSFTPQSLPDWRTSARLEEPAPPFSSAQTHEWATFGDDWNSTTEKKQPPARPPPPKTTTSMSPSEMVSVTEMFGMAEKQSAPVISANVANSNLNQDEKRAKVLEELINTELQFVTDINAYTEAVDGSTRLSTKQKVIMKNGCAQVVELARALVQGLINEQSSEANRTTNDWRVFPTTRKLFGNTYGYYFRNIDHINSLLMASVRHITLSEIAKVNKLYTSPIAIRALMAMGDEYVTSHSRSSLEILGTVGEPINPAAWKWLYEVVGEGKCAIVDTFWQTETGGHMITPMPGATPMKPGSATFPFFSVNPVILDSEGRIIEGPGEGNLCFDRAWPGMLRTVFGDHDRFLKTYFAPFNGYYFTGDVARGDKDGYLWITGELMTNLMNVSGHLLSTAEIESALVAHGKVAEAAVVAAPHDIKRSFPYAFLTLNDGEKMNPSLTLELKNIIRKRIGAIAVPEVIQSAPGLPKTRSGKVTRRILRKIAEGCESGMGDTTTLVDEEVIKHLIAGPVHG